MGSPPAKIQPIPISKRPPSRISTRIPAKSTPKPPPFKLPSPRPNPLQPQRRLQPIRLRRRTLPILGLLPPRRRLQTNRFRKPQLRRLRPRNLHRHRGLRSANGRRWSCARGRSSYFPDGQAGTDSTSVAVAWYDARSARYHAGDGCKCGL